MKLNKRIGIIGLSAMILVAVALIIHALFPWITTTKEERFLDDFMGTYVISEYAFTADTMVSSSKPTEENLTRTRFYFNKDNYYSLSKTGIDMQNNYSSMFLIDPVEYTCVKITDEFLENGIPQQGGTLRNLFNTNKDFHEKVKGNAYAILVDYPDDFDPYYALKTPKAFYFINGEYLYSNGVHVFKLEKLR